MKKWVYFFSFLLFALCAYADVALQTSYAVTSNWNSGYNIQITLTNASTSAISSWKVDFDIPAGQTLASLWNGSYVSNQNHVTASNATWNGTLQPQQSTTIGLQINNPQVGTPGINNVSASGSASSGGGGGQTGTPLYAEARTANSWSTGYQITMIITNNTSNPTTSWTVNFTLPQGQKVTNIWNGVLGANGTTVTNPTWSGVLAPGSSTTFGMVISGGSSGITNVQAFANGTPTPPPPPPQPVPAAPTLNTITATSPNSFTVSWGSVANATSYTLQQSTSSTFANPVVVGQGNIFSESFTNEPNGTYYYRVAATNSSGSSGYSNVQSIVVNVPVQLSAPTLQAISNASGAGQYTVSWTTVANAQNYTLQEGSDSNFTTAKTIFTGTATSFQVTANTAGTYYYRVTASAGSSTSSFSNVQSTTVTPPPVQLSAPTLQPISNATGAGQYTVSWSAVTNAQSYTLQEATNSGFTSAQTVFTGTATSFQVTGKSAGTYYYRVTASAGTSVSPVSNVQSTVVNPTQPPPAPGTNMVVGYWETWNSQPPLSTIVNMHAEIIPIGFGKLVSTGNHTFQVSGLEASPSTITQLITLVHSAGKKVLISIGGASFKLKPILLTTDDAMGMAQAILTYIQQNSLDGVDLDFEDDAPANLQIAVIQNLRTLLGPNKIISYTPGTPAATYGVFPQVIKGSFNNLSYISFMAYDYGPGYNYTQDVTAFLGWGIPPAKIVIGLMPGKDDQGVLTSVSNITQAAQYAKQNGLGGIMFWDLNRDHLNTTGLGVDAATNAVYSVFHP